MEKGHQTWWPEPILMRKSVSGHAGVFSSGRGGRLSSSCARGSRASPCANGCSADTSASMRSPPKMFLLRVPPARAGTLLAIPDYKARKRGMSSAFPPKSVHNSVLSVDNRCGKTQVRPDCLLITLPSFDKIGKRLCNRGCIFPQKLSTAAGSRFSHLSRRRELSTASCALFFCGARDSYPQPVDEFVDNSSPCGKKFSTFYYI